MAALWWERTYSRPPPGAIKRLLSPKADNHPDHTTGHNCGDDAPSPLLASQDMHGWLCEEFTLAREAPACPIPAPSVRKKPEVRFQKPLPILQLTRTQLGIAPPPGSAQVRSRPSLPCPTGKPVTLLQLTAHTHHTPPDS